MGNCLCSNKSGVDATPLVYGRFVSQLRRLETVNGVAVEVEASSWAAHHPLEDAHCVHFSGNCVFIGVFDGIGGSEASRLCQAEAWPAFQACLSRCAGDVSQALGDTVSQLDDLFFARTEQKAVRAYVGTSATLCWADLVNGTLTVASHGLCSGAFGALEGAFSGQYLKASLLPGVDLEGRVQDEQRLHALFPSTSRPLFETVGGKRLLLGLSPVTRAIGLGVLKHHDLAVWHNHSAATQYRITTLPSSDKPYVLSKPFTVTTRLELSEHPLVVGSGGLWQLLSPSAAVAWCHSRRAVPSGPLPTDDPEGEGSNSTATPNTADSLILYALSTTTSKLTVRGREQSLMTVDDVASVACSSVTEGAKGHPKGKSAAPQPNLTRVDLHDDLTCVILSTGQPIRPTTPPREGGLLEGWSARQRHRTRASHYWDLCRALHRFHVIRRRALLHRWFAVIHETCAVHKKYVHDRARQAEVDAWRNEGKVIQVTNSGVVEPVDVHLQW